MPDLSFTREAQLGEPGADARVPVVVSTEYPVDRGEYVEVLSHESPAHVDLERAPLPLLTLHDSRRLPIGVVEDLRVDTRKRQLRGFARFANTPEAQAVLQAVRERIVRSVSIGYQLVRELRRSGSRRYFAFQPYECSAVGIPADPGAAFYRSGHPSIMDNDNTQAPPSDDGTTRSQRRAENRAAFAEADRVKEIVSLGAQYARYLRPNDVAEACERGMTAAEFREHIMDRMQTRASDTSPLQLGMSRREAESYSLGRAIVASITGDWRDAGLEREASRALEKATGRAAEGFLVPSDYWRRDFNVGTSTEAGNLVATALQTDLWTDALRNALVFGGLGVKMLPGLSSNIDIPRKATPGSLGMLTEIGSASETNPTIAKVSLTPKRIGAYIEYSKQALVQSAMALEPLLRDDLLTGAAVLLEYQCINGAGTGAEIRGIRNTTGIGTSTAGANGATVAWQHFLDLEAAVANANAVPGVMAGYLLNTKTKAKAKGVQRGTSLDFIIPGDVRADAAGALTVNSYKALFSNNVPSNLTKGTSTTVCSAALFGADWSNAVLATFGAPDVVVDPYSLAATGQVRIAINVFADFGIRQPAAFSKIEDLLTA